MSSNEALIPSGADEPAQALQQRFQRDGYLYFKRQVAPEKCASLLQDFLHCLTPHIDYDQAPGSPVFRGEPFFETDPIWDEVYPRMQSLYEFHNFFHQDDIQQLMQTLAGEQVFVYPMKMGRIATPKKIGYETPPHQYRYALLRSRCPGFRHQPGAAPRLADRGFRLAQYLH